MNPSSHIAYHLHQVLFGGNWTWTNLKDTLSDVRYMEAEKQLGSLNSILSLTHHLSYYFRVQLKVLEGGSLEGSDKDSWNSPEIDDEDAWESMVEEILETGLKLCEAIRDIREEQWDSFFTEEKYGSYYRNFHGMIEHTHYHLGQIVLIKKLIRSTP